MPLMKKLTELHQALGDCADGLTAEELAHFTDDALAFVSQAGPAAQRSA